MRLATVLIGGREEAAVETRAGPVPLRSINAHFGTAFPLTVQGLVELGISPRLAELARSVEPLDAEDAMYGPVSRHPRKIWGIGLNYRQHADDLGAPYPTEPASFLKGEHTIIGPGEKILLPPQSQRVTAEAELGVVIGRTSRFLDGDEVERAIAGVCLIIDMTAEDILLRNPRFLTRSKNFDTFLSLGSQLITLDEIPDLASLKVGTYRNGKLHRESAVSDMSFSPLELVAFHSHVATLYAGDIISTGTPGAVVIEDGDVAECRISGLGRLSNPVRRMRPLAKA